MSTWTCERDGSLLGCGVDAESTARFTGPAGETIDPWSMIFTDREVAHARTLDEPAVGLCASFCAKEAVIKALGTSIDPPDCELFFSPGQVEQVARLGSGLCEEHGIADWSVRVDVIVSGGVEECVATALLFGRGP